MNYVTWPKPNNSFTYKNVKGLAYRFRTRWNLLRAVTGRIYPSTPLNEALLLGYRPRLWRQSRDSYHYYCVTFPCDPVIAFCLFSYYSYCMYDENFNRITQNPSVMGGKPCIRGMRVTVGMIVGQIGAGVSVEELLTDYHYLEREDIMQALGYAAALAQWREVSLAEA
jgi:uncharacterized protein (DUF433 family)